MGGVNYSRVSVHQDQDATYRSIPPSHDSLDITAPYKLGCALGIGYAFDSHWSTELRFTSRKGSGDLEEAALDAYGLSVSYRF
jgi:hypothetical protein